MRHLILILVCGSSLLLSNSLAAPLWADSGTPMECDPQLSPVDCYRNSLERSIHKQWAPKAFPQAQRATVRFVLNRQGQLVGLRMKQSSGISALDESIQEAVISAAPFQPFPKQLSASEEEAAFEFTFDYVPSQEKNQSKGSAPETQVP